MTASATSRSSLLSISARCTVRNAPSSRAAPIASASLRRQRSRSFASGRCVTMEICSEDGSTLESSGNRVSASTCALTPPRGSVSSSSASTSANSSATPTEAPLRYPAAALVAFGKELLRESGVRDDMARDVAAVLVDGDLLGHTTHGLALLPAYLAEIDQGTMAKSGEPI